MTWAAWGPTIVAIVTAIFIAGQITGRIKNQETTLVEHHDRLDGHDKKLEDHGLAIMEAKAWREGYNAGSKT
jgi:hypothetical protein